MVWAIATLVVGCRFICNRPDRQKTARSRSQSSINRFDYDLTLANKSIVSFHDAPLTPEQHNILSALSEKVGRFVVVTARGEESVRKYLLEHGALDAVLASNTGHLLRPDINKDDQITLPAVNLTQVEVGEAVTNIHAIITRQ